MGGGRGDDVHANATFVFSFFCSRAGGVHCGSSKTRPVQLDSPRTNAHLEANQTNCNWYHVQMTMLLMLLMPRLFFDHMAIVLAADDHEYDSVVRLWLCCKFTLCQPVLAVSCCFTLETSAMQKARVFKACQTKTSKLTLKINKNQRRKAWYLRHFRKNLTKKQDKPIKTNKVRSIVFLTKTTQISQKTSQK